MFLMGLCLIMQVLALIPHHHHGADQKPCVNLIHCLGDTEGHDCVTDAEGLAPGVANDVSDHTHGTKDGKCSLDNMNVIRVDREDAFSGLLTDSDILLYAVFVAGSDEDPCGHCHLDTIIELNIKQNPDITPAYVSYISVAMPPRAPSFTV